MILINIYLIALFAYLRGILFNTYKAKNNIEELYYLITKPTSLEYEIFVLESYL